MKKRFAQKLWRALPWLWLAAGYLYMMWYHIVPGAWLVDSDMAGEMVLADLLNQEGGILTTNWYYSTELSVFEMQWFYRLGLLLFPHDWHAARVFSMALALALFAAAFLFFARAAGFARMGVWIAAALMWPFGFWYLFLVLYGGYSLVYLYYSLFTCSIVLYLCRGKGPRLLWAAGILLGLMSGLNGVRQLMLLYVPLLAAAAALAAWRLHLHPSGGLRGALRAFPAWKPLLGAPLLFTLCSGAGYLVNMGLLSKTHYFTKYDDLLWQSGERSLPQVWQDFLLLFGFQEKQSLFSLGGIAGGCGLLLALAFLLSLIRLCLRFGRLELSQQLIVAYVISALFVCGLVFSFTTVYEPNYWLPLLPFGLALLQIEAETETFAFKGTRPCLTVAFALAITLCSVSTVQAERKDPLRAKPGLEHAVDWLVENGYKEGYAFFWTSQVVTELSDGQIEMCTLNYEFWHLMPWLQRVDHWTRLPEMPCFSLFASYEDPGPLTTDARLVYDDGMFRIYAYDDPATVPTLLELPLEPDA